MTHHRQRRFALSQHTILIYQIEATEILKVHDYAVLGQDLPGNIALNRGKSKTSQLVAFNDKTHGAMTQVTGAIEDH